MTSCVGITGYLSETFFLYLLRKTLFLQSFLPFFGSNILASFTEFLCQDTYTFGFIRVQTLTISIEGNFLHK